ncbi:hypothetical protein DEU56DRAFT_744042 [Suillus clintonianus]|uniref:uncharacterized protein n=1 Tax=Suillus clintonianus TaxID=1904413 RepID=UPI001B87E3BB|nr:uncharacterized protein DEU56DRAFT_744042 [Suillus clintonianus]KAG2125081.1 hypothetical protein DEU56DRAFT_744042 [Suillus clintonianus]
MSPENEQSRSQAGPIAESTAVTDKGTKTKPKVLSVSTKTVWKSSDDAVLIATLLKEREEGHQSDSGFKPKSFIACAEALKGSEKTSGGVAKTSGSCHDHWGKLKKDFAVVKKLREQSGFGWDNTLKIVTAPPDVWEKYLAVGGSHQITKVWRKKSFPLYNSIQILVEGIVATGKNVFRVGMTTMTETVDTTLLFNHPADSGEDNQMLDDKNDEDVDDLQTMTPIKPNNRKCSAVEMTPFGSSCKRQPTGRAIRCSSSGRGSGTDAMFSVAGAIETLADKFNESGGLTSPERCSAAIHCLEDDDDLSETEQVAAVHLFSRQTAIADSYLVIKKKSTRTRYIQSELAEFSLG